MYQKLQVSFFLTLLIGLLILAFFVFQPYLAALIFGGVLSILFYPFYLRIIRVFRGGRESGRESIAAFLTILLVLVVVLLPLFFLGVQFAREVQGLYAGATGEAMPASRVTQIFEERIRTIAPSFSFNVRGYVVQLGEWIFTHSVAFVSGTAQLVLALFITLLTFYYALKDGPRFKRVLIELSPLREDDDVALFARVQATINSVIRGALVVAAVQGVLAGLGYLFFNIPNPVLWGTVTVIAALIPLVGTMIVTIPLSLFLMLQGDLFSGIGLLLWGTFMVGGIDNFLRPKLIERGIRIHPLFILLSVLGGLQLFGPVGFVLGPLTISVLFALLDIYRKEFRAPGGGT